jgi:CubicO group peptidase (beta-lactamase class C family)
MPYGGGGLVSTARDYDRFLAMLLGEGETGGVRIMKPETARLGMSNLLADSVDRKNTFIDGEGFGAGGRVSLAGSPTGEGVYGWGGAAGTVAFVDRRRGYRVGGYTQYMPSEALPFQRDFGKAFYKDVMA